MGEASALRGVAVWHSCQNSVAATFQPSTSHLVWWFPNLHHSISAAPGITASCSVLAFPAPPTPPQWLALEPILTAADIQRQLPSEARAFAAVDRQLKEVNRKAKDRPNALQAGTQPGLLEQLRRCNEALEGVAKNLEVGERACVGS